MTGEFERGLLPFGDALLSALEEALERHPAGEDVPWLSYFDGALAGLLLSPEGIEPKEWLPKLHAGPDEPFADPADRERFAGLLRQRQAEIALLLIEGGLAFLPIYEFDEDGEPLWQVWLAGFLGAMKLRMDAWQSLFESEDEDLAAAAMGLMSLATLLPGLADRLAGEEILGEIESELAADAPMMLPYFVETIYRRQHGLERVAMGGGFGEEDWDPPQQPIRVTKVGRNAPCPCGSGKKYKKCCGR